jgi:hypothetical protein
VWEPANHSLSDKHTTKLAATCNMLPALAAAVAVFISVLSIVIQFIHNDIQHVTYGGGVNHMLVANDARRFIEILAAKHSAR